MNQNPNSIKKTPFFGCLPQASFLSLGIWLLALIIDAIIGGPHMVLTQKNATYIFFVLLVIFLFFYFWAVFSLTPRRFRGELALAGIYRYLRHPMYASTIFILLPALAIYFHSWLLMLSCVPIYFIWRSCIKDEEKKLIEVFGDAYLKYQKNTWPFFPNLLNINKPLFFVITTLAVFIITFVSLNFSSFYLRSVQWQQDESESQTNVANLISQSNKVSNSNPAGQLPRPKPIYDKPNSIVIYKTNIDAPIVSASGTSKKELDAALNQGVVIYPDSKLPGEPGNVFLTGHSSTYPWNKTQYGQVFTLLDRLEPGDRVTIYYSQYKYEYEVTKKYVTTPDKVTISAGSQAKTLTLMTCWPIGTAWKRLVVEGVEIDGT